MLNRPNLKRCSGGGRSFRIRSLELRARVCKSSSEKLSGRELIRLILLLAPFVAVILARSGLPAIQAAVRNADASVGALVEAIDSRYSDVRTLKTEFVQTYVWGDTTRKESGTAYFARGGLMRWEYQQPKDKLVVADGKKMWLYIPQEKQVTQSPFKPQEDPPCLSPCCSHTSICAGSFLKLSLRARL